MSAPYANIRSAFATKLLAYPGVPSIAWENVAFTPVTGTTYLRPSLMVSEPNQAEIGENGLNHHTGVFQISILAPSGNGVGSIMTLMNGLVDFFKRGTRLTYSGTNIRITKVWPSPWLTEADRVNVPISIRFSTYATP